MPKQNYSKRHRYEVAAKLGATPDRGKVKEAAELLDVSTGDIRRWVREFNSEESNPPQNKNESTTRISDDVEDADDAYETVSFYLPSEIVDLCRELADIRQKVAREKIKTAKKSRRSKKAKVTLRRSASAIVHEALRAHKDKIESEIRRSQKKIIKRPPTPRDDSNEEEERRIYFENRKEFERLHPFMKWSQNMSYEEHLREIILESKRSKVKTFPGIAEHLNFMGKGTRSGLRWSKDGLRKFLKRAGKSKDDLTR